MADISIIHNGNTDYNVKDAVGREALAVVENKGAKNLLKLGFEKKTVGDQTAEMTADGNGIIVNGDRNTSSDVILVYDLSTNTSAMSDTRYTIPEGKYVIAPTGTSGLRIQVYCHDGGGVNSERLGQASTAAVGFEYTSALKAQYPYIAYRLWASRVSSFSNLTVYPMVCSKAEWDISQAYVPYGKTNAELTNDTSTLFTENTRQETEIGVVANAGAKNLLQFDSLPSGTTTYTTAGVKFDILSDGSVKAERVSASTSVANTSLKIGGNNVYIDNFCNGKFILSGCPSGGGSSTYELMASITGGAYTKRDYGSGVLLTDKGSYSNIYVQCTVRSSFDGTVIFKPMIRYAAITDPTFQPYAKTNVELTNENKSQQAEINHSVNTGVKNLLNLSGITPTVPSGLTLTYNNDGTFSVSGTLANANSIAFPIDAISGNLILSGCPSGGGESSYMLRLTKSGTAVSASTDTGSGSQIFSMDGTGYALGIRFAAGTYTNVTFKPMIRSAAITDPTFQPFARTNPELTVLTDEDRAALVEIVDSGAKNLSRWNSGTSTSAEPTLAQQIPFTSDGGEYTISYNTALTTGKIYIGFKDSNGTATLTVEIGNANKVKTITIPANTAYFNVYAPTFGDYSNFMICTKAAWDISHQYEPYAKTNPELTVLTDEDRAALVEIVDSGAKNVRSITLDELKTLGGNAEFAWSGNVATKSNVSFTINTDGTITVNAAQAASAQVILDIYRMPSDASDMVLSGAPSGGDADSYFQYVKGTTFRDYGEGVMYSKTGAHSIGLVIAQGYRPQNLTFKTMICTSAAWKISKVYQQYRPSWQEMYERIVALENHNT